MSGPINSRNVAEHLCTLATLLEAEAMKAHVLGLQTDKRLSGEARRIRDLANRLWEANAMIALERTDAISGDKAHTQLLAPSPHSGEPRQTSQEPARRRGRRNQMKLVSA